MSNLDSGESLKSCIGLNQIVECLPETTECDKSPDPDVTDFFMNDQEFISRVNAIKEEFASVSPELLVKHPVLFPEQYAQYRAADFFGKADARPIIVDGSNVAFGRIFQQL